MGTLKRNSAASAGVRQGILRGAATSSKLWIRDQIVWLEAMKSILQSSEKSWDGQIIDLRSPLNRQSSASQKH